MASRPWTLPEMNRARDLYAAGHTYAEVGRAIGRTTKAVSMQMCKHGHSRPKPSGRPRSRRVQALYRRAYVLRQEGLTWSQVGAQIGKKQCDAVKCARFYAERYEFPWPVVVAGQEAA